MELVVWDVGLREYFDKFHDARPQPVYSLFCCAVVHLRQDKGRFLRRRKLRSIKHNRRAASVSAVATPHRQQTIRVLFYVLRETKNIGIQHMLVSELVVPKFESRFKHIRPLLASAGGFNFRACHKKTSSLIYSEAHLSRSFMKRGLENHTS